MSRTIRTVVTQRPAMGTLFEVVLVGNDNENLTALGEAVLDEIERVEAFLSCKDSRSLVSRLNREAFAAPVRVDPEFAAILSTCRLGFELTEGCFDITAGSSLGSDRVVSLKDVEFDANRSEVRFRQSHVRLDFGGFGKGYALDRGALLVDQFAKETGSIRGAFFHGGTSSSFGLGVNEAGQPWRVDLQFGNQDASPEAVVLDNRSLSCSATVHAPGEQSDLVDPQKNERLTGEAVCAVATRSAQWGEILSTALVCMGTERAACYIRDCLDKSVLPEAHVIWWDRVDGEQRWVI